MRMLPLLPRPAGRRRRVALVTAAVLASSAAWAVLPALGAATTRPVTSARPRLETAGMVLGGVGTAERATSATIVIPAFAALNGYKTRAVTISQGGTLSAVNQDRYLHSVTSDAVHRDGTPLFSVDVKPGTTRTIAAASTLAPGTYRFHCKYHPNMTGTLTVEGTGGGTHGSGPSFDQPLKLPPVLTGAHLTIPITRSLVRVLPNGPRTPMWTYGGSYPGPTIRRPAGRATTVTFVDRLAGSSGPLTVHLHGDHHSSAADGRPDQQLIEPGGEHTYRYPLTDGGKPERDAFDFYHDHRMSRTGHNNWMGLQGMFLIDDARERQLPLPKGSYDVPLMISDRSFTATNALTDPWAHRSTTLPVTGPDAPPGDATVGDRILVDGRFAPYLSVAAHRYRLRLLNASNFQSYDFALSDGRAFLQVGNGSGLLPAPVKRTDILLGPAQRADVVVDFHGLLHRKVVLRSINRSNTGLRGVGTPAASLMQFRVDRTAADHTRVPATLEKPPAITVPKRAAFTWTFALAGDSTSGTYWTVNGQPFDPTRVDHTVVLGSTEKWVLKNQSPITHYIHLHEEQWHTISRDGKRPPPWERGLEDTWRLDPGETVVVAARFTDYTGPFMIHCHMLDHEDHGMMAQFAVVRPGTAAAAAARSHGSTSAGAATTTTTTTGMTMAGMPVPGGAASPAHLAAVPAGIAARFGGAVAAELGLLAALGLALAGLRRYLGWIDRLA